MQPVDELPAGRACRMQITGKLHGQRDCKLTRTPAGVAGLGFVLMSIRKSCADRAAREISWTTPGCCRFVLLLFSRDDKGDGVASDRLCQAPYKGNSSLTRRIKVSPGEGKFRDRGKPEILLDP